MSDRVSNSLVIPVYKNEENIPDLIDAVRDLDAQLGGDLEVVFVVDGSPDRSHALLRGLLPGERFESQLLLLSRNFGAFAAIRRGMEVARGTAIAVMAADLQEPISLARQFFEKLGNDEADVLLGKRTRRADSALNKLASGLFWGFYRRWVMREMPVGGVDMFGCSSRARDDLVRMGEANTSLVSQLLWVGGRRLEVPYERKAREHGRSAWTWSRKFRYMLDSIFAFSDLPIFLLLWVGTAGVLVSCGVGAVVLVAWASGAIEVAGYTPVMLLVSLIGSVLIFGQGIIGSYVWRASENTKQRPLSFTNLHEVFDASDAPASSTMEAKPDAGVGVES